MANILSMSSRVSWKMVQHQFAFVENSKKFAVNEVAVSLFDLKKMYLNL